MAKKLLLLTDKQIETICSKFPRGPRHSGDYEATDEVQLRTEILMQTESERQMANVQHVFDTFLWKDEPPLIES